MPRPAVTPQRRRELDAALLDAAAASGAAVPADRNATPATREENRRVRLRKVRKTAGAVAEIAPTRQEFQDVMEMIGLLSYEPGTPPKADPAKGPLVKYLRPGQR